MKFKEKILTLLLTFTLLTASLTACQKTPDSGDEIDHTTTESTTFEPPSGKLDKELNIQDIPSTEEFINAIACNGVYYNSPILYTIHSSGDLILYISEWNEFFVVPKREDMYLVAETVEASCAVLSENKCTIFFRDFAPDDKPISLIQFTKGHRDVTIRPLNLPEGNYSYGQKYCNFIDEKTGYLFLLDGPNDIQLRHLFKTTDSGETWTELSVETSPSIYWKEEIICAKMLNEQVGCIFGSHNANDDLSAKTYVTADSGKTWHKVGSFIELGSVEAYDFAYESGEYIIFLRTARGLGAQKYSKQLVSTDLINWTLVE